MGSTPEDPIDPARRIIDPHHHLWFAGDSHAKTAPTYLYDDLAEDAAGHNVVATVFVEAGASYRRSGPEPMRPVGETEFAVGQARSRPGPPHLAAIVAYADMSLGAAVEEVVAAHEVAGEGRLRGIRQGMSHDPHVQSGPARVPGQLGHDAVRRALACLGQHGYSFDAWVFHPQLAELADAVRAVDGTTFVVGHLGAPLARPPYTDRDETLSVWRAGMRQLAASPNTVVKLGGIGMEALFATSWSGRPEPPRSDEVVDRWRDEIRWCIDTFGPARCMFESNFPVDGTAIPYTVLWNAFKKIAAPYSEAEQDELFFGTASRVYRLTDVDHWSHVEP